MMIQKLLVAAAGLAMLCGVSAATAQDCGCENQASNGWTAGARNVNMYGYWYAHNRHARNCGRIITNEEAASLWSSYCYDDCSYHGGSGCDGGAGCGGGCGHGCNLLGLFKNRRNLGSFAGGGFDRGCFGWPAACGNGCGGGFAAGGFGHGCGHGCGLLSALKSRLHGGFGHHHGGACGDGCNQGCGCSRGGGRFFGGSGAGLGHGGFLHRLFHRCGSRNSYFNEFTGPDYGDCDIQSCVNGSITNACGCNGAVAAPGNQGMAYPQAAPTPANQTPAQNAMPAAPSLAPENNSDTDGANEIQGELLDK